VAFERLIKTVSEAVANEEAQYFEGVKVPDAHSTKSS
jgi:hypothetical protein